MMLMGGSNASKSDYDENRLMITNKAYKRFAPTDAPTMRRAMSIVMS